MIQQALNKMSVFENFRFLITDTQATSIFKNRVFSKTFVCTNFPFWQSLVCTQAQNGKDRRTFKQKHISVNVLKGTARFSPSCLVLLIAIIARHKTRNKREKNYSVNMTKPQLLVKRICSRIRLQLQTVKITFEKLLGKIVLRFNVLLVCPSVPFYIHVSVGSGPIFERTNFLHRTMAILLQCTVYKGPYNFFLPVSALKWLFYQWRVTIVVSRLLPRKLCNTLHDSVFTRVPVKIEPYQSKVLTS